MLVDLTELGIRVGHVTDETGMTGCTVIVAPPGTTGSGEIRGGAPATREFGVLSVEAAVQHVDAVVLSGGSAFGLATADGVVQSLRAIGRGVPTTAGPVPIVVAMALYDLTEGAAVHPGAAAGATAFDRAENHTETGRIGAATGATICKWREAKYREEGGLGVAVLSGPNDVVVGAIVAVNAWGGIDDGVVREKVREGQWSEWPSTKSDVSPPTNGTVENTTIGVVVTNAELDKIGCRRMATASHGGIDRALFPSHALPDGDAIVALSTGSVKASVPTIELIAATAMESAIRSVQSKKVENAQSKTHME